MEEKGNAYTCLYTGITAMKMKVEKEFRHIRRVMRTSIGTVTKVSVEFVGKRKKKTRRR